MVPLSAFAHFAPGTTPLAVNHQGLFAASTISFNLAPGIALSDRGRGHQPHHGEIGVPGTIHGTFQGTAQVFQQSLASEPILIARGAGRRLHRAGHPLRELHPPHHHPLDPALGGHRRGARAAASRAWSSASSALIGVILLIGIVKKNAIMMIDFALDAERRRGLDPRAMRSTRPACCASARS